MIYPIKGRRAAAEMITLCETMFPVVIRIDAVSAIHDELFAASQGRYDPILQMKTLDDWCTEQFGPIAFSRAKPLVNPGVYGFINDEALWVRVDDEYRFRDTTQGTAFKLVWC
ncbi:MAG: hypothetical protein EOP83_05760 [Verrucomicrobiaceae bacterium]|nr:MAG: hypothetical protein EOP83_05760 [Verrucomicrobiaceae bacterium]